ncbi:ERF family protein [Proteus vulgaris]|nr:ERF family protein [Proteus vulgaris]
MSAVYKAISNVAKEMAETGIKKGSKNQQQGFMFRGIDAVYNALAPALVKHGLLILPRIIERSVTERQTQRGGQLFYVVVKAEFDFVATEDGSKHTVVTYGEAMDSGDKATNKAMSIAYKYAAFQAFCIPTEETAIDADAEIHNVAPRTAEQVLADYTNFLGTATNQSQIMDEYKKAWNALAGTESQKECERLTGIRIKELKEAA